ncbi:RHS repeat-associated core domain-containing protein, partial [Chryseobacterium indologenes]
TFVEQQVAGTYENPYKFNAKELDSETGLYYYGARYYNPRLSFWYGVDPLAIYNSVMETEFYGEGQHNGGFSYWGNLNPYIYTYQNPITYIDPNGKQTKGQQIGIAIKNPFKIGLMNRAGHDLADIAGEFSRRGATSSAPFAVLERNGPVASDADRGGERGAFRHATWMALIASEYGSKDAKWVGDLHEGKSTNTSKTTNILGIIGADTVTDELNNEIGRNYGEKNKGAQARDIALGVLEIYNKEGLYQVENSGNGTNKFNVVRKKLDNEKYNLLKKRFNTLSNDGVSPRPTKSQTQNAIKKYIRNGTP